MKKLYSTACLILFCVILNAQETLTFSGYDGAGSTINATISTVNDNITIVFEDIDIINNFYTQFQNEIYMYGGLDTDSGGFQGSPDFNNLASHPQLLLIDSDNNAQPNTYSITINLAQQYSAVPDGTNVYGFNLLFQNQFGGGGNNQTVDLYINLLDALKDSTLGVGEFSNTVSARYINGSLMLANYTGSVVVSVFEITGRMITTFNDISNSNTYRTILELPKNQLSFIQIEGSNFKKTLKIISK